MVVSNIKVLLISHNPLSTYQNMGKTFISLFSSFAKQEICQLYVFPSFPNIDVASSFFRITDRDAFQVFFSRKCAGGEVGVHPFKGNIVEDRIDKRFYIRRSNHSPQKRLLRDTIWKISPWNSRRLKEWLDREAPTCIFLAPGYAKFIYDIALKIAKDRNIPIITYVCDDYYFVNEPKTLLGRYQLKTLQKKIQEIMQNTKRLIAISQEIGEKYAEEFSVNTDIIMTGSAFDVARIPANVDKINGFWYFGNVGVNREKSLADIGRILDEKNKENHTEYFLNVYSGTPEPLLRTAFAGIKSIKLRGFLVGEAFLREFTKAECLVHVEAFEQESVDLVKGSVSTKIADSLASGKPLLAYGPEGIASIEHLKKNHCAFCATTLSSLKEVINEIITDKTKRKEFAENAIRTAKQYHVSATNSEHLKAIMQEIEATK